MVSEKHGTHRTNSCSLCIGSIVRLLLILLFADLSVPFICLPCLFVVISVSPSVLVAKKRENGPHTHSKPQRPPYNVMYRTWTQDVIGRKRTTTIRDYSSDSYDLDQMDRTVTPQPREPHALHFLACGPDQTLRSKVEEGGATSVQEQRVACPPKRTPGGLVTHGVTPDSALYRGIHTGRSAPFYTTDSLRAVKNIRSLPGYTRTRDSISTATTPF